jgi:hypothetical protein
MSNDPWLYYDAWKTAYPPEWDEPNEDEEDEEEHEHMCSGCFRFRPGQRCLQQAQCSEVL